MSDETTVNVVVAYSGMVADVTVDGLSGYSPDVLDDVSRRAVRTLSDVIAHVRAHHDLAHAAEQVDE